MEELKNEVVNEEVVADTVVDSEENLDEATKARLRKFREAEAKQKAKEEEAERKLAEKQAKIQAKLELDMKKHYERKAKHDAWKSKLDEKRIARDNLEKERDAARRDAKRTYYTQSELTPLLANRSPYLHGKKD